MFPARKQNSATKRPKFISEVFISVVRWRIILSSYHILYIWLIPLDTRHGAWTCNLSQVYVLNFRDLKFALNNMPWTHFKPSNSLTLYAGLPWEISTSASFDQHVQLHSTNRDKFSFTFASNSALHFNFIKHALIHTMGTCTCVAFRNKLSFADLKNSLQHTIEFSYQCRCSHIIKICCNAWSIHFTAYFCNTYHILGRGWKPGIESFCCRNLFMFCTWDINQFKCFLMCRVLLYGVPSHARTNKFIYTSFDLHSIEIWKTCANSNEVNCLLCWCMMQENPQQKNASAHSVTPCFCMTAASRESTINVQLRSNN